MSMGNFERYNVYPIEQVPVAQQIRDALGVNLDQVAAAGVDYESFELVGGLGFGDFSPASSDIDTWMTLPNLPPRERLETARRLNDKFGTVRDTMIEQGHVGEHNFRHPPTFLTEAESEAYRKSFVAKIGLPIALGVFPALRGTDHKGDFCFTDTQLMQDVAYSSCTFYHNVLNPPMNGVEDPVRYCYKRATYFMRFKLLYDTGIYVPTKGQLLDACETELPEWQALTPILRKVQDADASQWPTLLQIQNDVLTAMRAGMEKYWADGALTEDGLAKGNMRTQLHWTLEKLRWDFLLMPRTSQVLRDTMTDGPVQVWGFSFDKVDHLLQRLQGVLPNDAIRKDWDNFKSRHLALVGTQTDGALPSYYDEVYHPTLAAFFDKTAESTNKLF